MSNMEVHPWVQTGQCWTASVPFSLAEALILALCVSAAGAFALLFGTELLPVGLAVLVDQSNLRWEWCGGRGGLLVGLMGVVLGLSHWWSFGFFILILRREG